MDREQLVELVTRQVIAGLEARESPRPFSFPSASLRTGLPEATCFACEGTCTQKCPDEVRAIVQAGASRVTGRLGNPHAPVDLAPFIDHTLLRPEATPAQIAQLCAEARQYGFATVCVNSAHVRQAAQLLRGSPVKVCAVVGFPLGASTTEAKVFEARKAIRDGAREIDMVINVGALKGGNYALVKQDIAKVVEACHESRAVCKVIIEAALLTDEEKVIACQLAKEARADFVKTSTGFGPGGATERDVALMRLAVGPEMGIKAAGGIRTAEDALKMIRAGATRIGASASVKIMQEARVGRVRE
jgi:deoxyribose-phosphate aldolase